MKLKSFNEFLNETADMMFMPVDPIRSIDKVYRDFYKGIKDNMQKFIENIKTESKETKEAFQLVVKASRGEIKLTEEQTASIYLQLKDVLKTLGLVAISSIPGATLVFILIKFLKAEKYVFPSAFLK